MRTRRLTIAGCALLLGALFFPIGPDGLSPRDAAVSISSTVACS